MHQNKLNKNFFTDWHDNIIATTGTSWTQVVNVTGSCRQYAGPRILYASIVVDFLPNDQFEVSEVLDSESSNVANTYGWFEYIVFGVLDVMLTVPSLPIKNFKLSIREIKYNDIESNQIAFRLAGRDAAVKALRRHFPNMHITG